MHRILFQWRGIKVYSYPAMLFIGLVFGVLGGTYTSAFHGLDPTRIFLAELFLLLPALFGSRLLYVVVHWTDYCHQPRRILSRTDGGAHLYGGLILSFVVSIPLLYLIHIPFGAFWDTAAITILIGMIFTRVGCLLNGCCSGKACTGIFSIPLTDINGVTFRRYPTQIMEAALGAVLLSGSLFSRNKMPFDGASFLMNVALYSFGRYFLELHRERSDRLGAIRVNQAISIGMIFAAGGMYTFNLLNGFGTSVTQKLTTAAGIDSHYLIMAPLAVLAVLALFHSVGCQLFFPLDVHNIEGDYPQTILNETNTKPDLPVNRVLIAYWRLQEPPSPTPTTAADELGVHPGTYSSVTLPSLPNSELDQDHSPTTAQPSGTTVFGAPGLLGVDPPAPATNNSIEVNGGFVSVAATSAFTIPAFTLEALINPMWDLTTLGKYYSVLEYTTIASNKKLGIAIYAGPENVSHLNTPYRWQIWLSHTSGATSKFEQVMQVTGSTRPLPLVEPNKTNYIAVTCDGSTIQLYTTFEGKLSTTDLTQLHQDAVQALDEPVAYVQNGGATEFLIGMGRDSFGPFAATPPLERYPFNGRIQEVAIYKEVLTWDRIISHIGAAFENF